MPLLYQTAADLLALFNDLTGRNYPAGADKIDDPTKYVWLTRAQLEVITEIASYAPQVLYPKVGTAALPQMATTDQNVFTFGVDANGNKLVPFGNTQIYRRTTDVPYRPLIPCLDYLDEVDQIRLPRGRTYSGPLYWRGMVQPADINANTPGCFVPIVANELTAIRAAKNFAAGGGVRNPALITEMNDRWDKRFPHMVLLWKRQFSAGGAVRWLALTDIVTPL